jgi:hypothetical protein
MSKLKTNSIGPVTEKDVTVKGLRSSTSQSSRDGVIKYEDEKFQFRQEGEWITFDDILGLIRGHLTGDDWNWKVEEHLWVPPKDLTLDIIGLGEGLGLGDFDADGTDGADVDGDGEDDTALILTLISSIVNNLTLTLPLPSRDGTKTEGWITELGGLGLPLVTTLCRYKLPSGTTAQFKKATTYPGEGEGGEDLTVESDYFYSIGYELIKFYVHYAVIGDGMTAIEPVIYDSDSITSRYAEVSVFGGESVTLEEDRPSFMSLEDLEALMDSMGPEAGGSVGDFTETIMGKLGVQKITHNSVNFVPSFGSVMGLGGPPLPVKMEDLQNLIPDDLHDTPEKRVASGVHVAEYVLSEPLTMNGRQTFGIFASGNEVGASEEFDGDASMSGLTAILGVKFIFDKKHYNVRHGDEELPLPPGDSGFGVLGSGGEHTGGALDSDDDGWSDISEIMAGTDPMDSRSHPAMIMGSALDSDGDGWTDEAELALGTDPGDPASHPVVFAHHPMLSEPTIHHFALVGVHYSGPTASAPLLMWPDIPMLAGLDPVMEVPSNSSFVLVAPYLDEYSAVTYDSVIMSLYATYVGSSAGYESDALMTSFYPGYDGPAPFAALVPYSDEYAGYPIVSTAALYDHLESIDSLSSSTFLLKSGEYVPFSITEPFVHGEFSIAPAPSEQELSAGHYYMYVFINGAIKDVYYEPKDGTYYYYEITTTIGDLKPSSIKVSVPSIYVYFAPAGMPGPAMPPADLDGDGLFDKVEAIIGTDPLSADDGPIMLDASGGKLGDDLIKPHTIVHGSFVDGKWVVSGVSESYLKDSDKDMLSDETEIALGTDPQNPDSDQDGISDGHEILLRDMLDDEINSLLAESLAVLESSAHNAEGIINSGEDIFINSSDKADIIVEAFSGDGKPFSLEDRARLHELIVNLFSNIG